MGSDRTVDWLARIPIYGISGASMAGLYIYITGLCSNSQYLGKISPFMMPLRLKAKETL